MLLQEETIKRADRERCQLVERVDAMERSLAATDNDKRLLEVLKTSYHVEHLPVDVAPTSLRLVLECFQPTGLH